MEQLTQKAPVVPFRRIGGAQDDLGLSRKDSWRENVAQPTFVRGARPQSATSRKSAAMHSGQSQPGFAAPSKAAAGGALAAARARNAAMRQANPKQSKAVARPRTAPIHGRGGKRQAEEDDWHAALERNGLLGRPAENSTLSKKYLQEAAARREREQVRLITQTYKEQEQYERGCIARMAEATRWAQALELAKKFNPIYIRSSQGLKVSGMNSVGRSGNQSPEVVSPPRSPSSPSGGAAKGLGDGNSAIAKFLLRGELRCEVVAKDDSKSRIISCELFEREHAKLLQRHRQMVLEEEGRTAFSAAQALHEAGVLAGSDQGKPSSMRRSRSVRKIMTSGASEEPGGDSSRQDLLVSKEQARRPGTEEHEIERELRAVLEETQNLTKILNAQVTLLKQNGWNMG